MNLEKYTERARGFIQSAQQLALRENHQQFTPEHVLKVLLDDEQGLCAGLIDKAGGRSKEALALVEAALKKIPKVQGSGAGQLYLAPTTARLFDSAASSPRRRATASSPSSGCLLRWRWRRAPRRPRFSASPASPRKRSTPLLPGEGGEIAFLAYHMPYLGVLEPSVVRIVQASGADVRLAVLGGFVEVRHNKVIMLADVAELAEEIDVERARRAKTAATNQLSTSADDAEAGAALQRANVRLEVAADLLAPACPSPHPSSPPFPAPL